MENWRLGVGELGDEVAMGTPGDEFWNWKGGDVGHELLDDEVVCDAEVGCCEAPFREREINSVHAEGDLVLQFARVGLLQTGAIPDDEGTFAFVNILQRGEATNALPPPRMKIRGGQFRQASE